MRSSQNPWFMVHVVMLINMPNAWLMANAANIFQRSFVSNLFMVIRATLFMHTLTMVTLLKRLFMARHMYLTIIMLFLTIPISVQSTSAISMWTFVPQSKQPSIFTSIFTRDMIGQPLRLQVIKKGMKSKNTWMHDISLLLKVTGTFLNILCMQNHPVCNVCQFIYQTKISFITIQMMMLMRSWIEHLERLH